MLKKKDGFFVFCSLTIVGLRFFVNPLIFITFASLEKKEKKYEVFD